MKKIKKSRSENYGKENIFLLRIKEVIVVIIVSGLQILVQTTKGLERNSIGDNVNWAFKYNYK